ncbi:hypothetical protein F5Y14DRAFT_244431 [Nemania sp. NC0429]|nr:hypothetical protein F5Y14DRAFT_244431 [Nemania sp. NC0429]
MYKRDNGTVGHDTLVIVLSTVFGVIGVLLIVLGGLWFLRNRRRHRLFNRGLTPIDDDEIETWKVSRADDEKETEQYRPQRSHASKDSTSSAKIQYQKGMSRPSTDAAVSTRSFVNHSFSIDLPRAPEPAAFARAPNARTGLTDETVPGDEPFVPQLKRQPSRLQKLPPSTPKNLSRANSRTRIVRSNSHPENWNNSSADSSPTGSKERSGSGSGSTHSRIYSSSFVPPPITSSASDKEMYLGLSPPPSRRQNPIGHALG